MSSAAADDRPRSRKNAEFWRAMKYLGPYRGMVAISIVCALLVGAVFTTGLGAMLPVFKVLLEDQTVAQWADRQIAEGRIGASFAENPEWLVVTRVKDRKPAAAAG